MEILNSHQGYISWLIAVKLLSGEYRHCNQGKAGGGEELENLDKFQQVWISEGRAPHLLFIWQNPGLNKKSSSTLYLAAMTFSASPTKWYAKTWMSKSRNLSAMISESCGWSTGLSKLSGICTMSASHKYSSTMTQTTLHESTHVSPQAPWSNRGYDQFGEDHNSMRRCLS